MNLLQPISATTCRVFCRITCTATTAFAIALHLSETSAALPPATTLQYVGKPFDPAFAIGSVPINGPITGWIRFSAPLVDGATLTQANVADFSLSSDGLTWTPDATFEYMRFVIGPSLLPTEWEIVLEQELLSGNTGVEQLATTTPGQGHFSEYFDEIVLGDRDINGPFSTAIDGKGINIGQPGQWMIPEPTVGSMAIVALVAVSSFRRFATAGRS